MFKHSQRSWSGKSVDSTRYVIVRNGVGVKINCADLGRNGESFNRKGVGPSKNGVDPSRKSVESW